MEPEAGWDLWRETRDELFRSHPQSPRPGYAELTYYHYDPAARVLAELEDLDAAPAAIETSGPRGAGAPPGGYGEERPRADALQAVCTGALRAARRGAGVGARLARELRRGRLPLLPRRDQRQRELRRRPLPARHGERRGSRGRRRAARARLQLRLQPVLLVRPGLGLSAGAPGEPTRGRRGGRGEAPLMSELDPLRHE